MRTEGGPVLGVVIPTLNEEDCLPALLSDLRSLEIPHRIVVADGGSSDETLSLAAWAGVRIVESAPGRGGQLNTGARALSTPWLFFIHADCRLPRRTAGALENWLRDRDPKTAAHFAFSLQGDHWFWRFLEFGQGLREHLSGLAYGDQGLVVSRTAFEATGGYPEIPLMEDVELLRLLRRSFEVERIPAPLPTSPRRYEEEGRWRGWLRNSALLGLHLLGVSPRRLAKWSGRRPRTRPRGDPERRRSPGDPAPKDTADAGTRTLLVFAKSPEPGRVKTRLAADLGEERAAELYRNMGRDVVDQVRDGPYRTVICHDPPEARLEIEGWLGARNVEFWPQEDGNLGQRMEEAFRRAFQEGAHRVCIIGTDAPEVDRTRVEEALEALDHDDVVLGPATDGGYYLLALRELRSALFTDIPWSTGKVLERTRDRIEALGGLKLSLLPPLTDVDTLEDLLSR